MTTMSTIYNRCYARLRRAHGRVDKDALKRCIYSERVKALLEKRKRAEAERLQNQPEPRVIFVRERLPEENPFIGLEKDPFDPNFEVPKTRKEEEDEVSKMAHETSLPYETIMRELGHEVSPTHHSLDSYFEDKEQFGNEVFGELARHMEDSKASRIRGEIMKLINTPEDLQQAKQNFRKHKNEIMKKLIGDLFKK